MTVACIVQARLGSQRFPGKVLADLAGKPVLQHVLERCEQIKGVDEVICAIPDGSHELAQFLLRSTIVRVIHGPENDVLARYLIAAQASNATTIMRITADCPLIDPDVCGHVLMKFQEGVFDYVSNVFPHRTYPQGFDCEVFSMKALEETAARDDLTAYDREHVTPKMQWNETYRIGRVEQNYDASHVRWTVDYPEDIARLEQVMKEAA